MTKLPSYNEVLIETIVALALISQIAYAFVALKPLQTGAEVVMLVLLFFACLGVTLSRVELLTLWVFDVMTTLSLFRSAQ